MKAKRWISLLLAVSMMLGVLAMPASAAAQQPESTAVVSEELPDAAALSAAEDENDIVNIRIRATETLSMVPIISWRWRPGPKTPSILPWCWAPAAKPTAM